jgi:hypothetical protein
MPRHARSVVAVALLLACSTGAARAQANPPSTNLSWDHCAADGRIADRTFTCDTNTGSETIVLSMVLHDSTRTGVVAWQAMLDVTPVTQAVPAWWGLGQGMCRSSAYQFLADWSGVALPPTTCWPWYGSNLASGVVQFTFDATDRFHVGIAAGLYDPATTSSTLLDGQEYALCRIRITHAKSVGTGACEGCTVPACIGVSQLELQYFGRPTDYFAGAGANSVTWQGGYVASYPTHSGAPCSHPSLCPYANQLQCTTPPVPAHGRTWGVIKALYR